MNKLYKDEVGFVAGGDTCGLPCDCKCSPGYNYLNGDQFCCTFPLEVGGWVKSLSGPTVLQCIENDGSYGAQSQALGPSIFALSCKSNAKGIIAICRQHIWEIPCNVTSLL